MTAMRIRALVAFCLMAATLAGAHVWRPTAHLADSRPKIDLESLFPKQFGGWRVDDRMPAQLVSPDMEAFLSKIYTQTLSRVYVDASGQRIMLSVAYGGDQSDATRAHRPEVCYPAQGFQIQSSEITELELGPQRLRVRRLLASQGGRIEPITYWITVGDRMTVTGTEQKLAQLSYSTRGLVPDGMLVRVSSIDKDIPGAYAIQQQFIADMTQSIAADKRPLVAGLVP